MNNTETKSPLWLALVALADNYIALSKAIDEICKSGHIELELRPIDAMLEQLVTALGFPEDNTVQHIDAGTEESPDYFCRDFVSWDADEFSNGTRLVIWLIRQYDEMPERFKKQPQSIRDELNRLALLADDAGNNEH